MCLTIQVQTVHTLVWYIRIVWRMVEYANVPNEASGVQCTHVNP